MLSRQRTRPVTCSTSRRRMTSGSVSGRAVMLATMATRVARMVGGGQGGGHLVGGGLHQRAVEGRRDVQRNGPRAQFLGLLDGAVDGGLVARDDDVAVVVVIGHDADADFRPGLRRLFGQGQIGLRADQRRHGAPAHRHGALHGLPAQLQQPGGVGERDRPGGAQGRIFAQRMAGHECLRGSHRTRTRPSAPASPRPTRPSGPAGRSRSGSAGPRGPRASAGLRFWPRASSTSAKTARAEAKASARAAPMPTDWLPCPGTGGRGSLNRP
jgi:hypothetical protein